MRFEGKHKVLKSAARSTSYKNILKTLAEHHQRLAAYTIYSGGCTSLQIEIGPGIYSNFPANDLVCIVNSNFFQL